MAGKAGSVLSQSEVEDMLAHDAAGVVRPEKYDGVVFDATSITGAVYRYATDEERKAGDAAAEDARAASDARAKRLDKLRAGAGVPVAETVRVPVADAAPAARG
jgi:hypothetical protein